MAGLPSHLMSVLIAVTAGLFIFGASTFYTDVWKQPRVNLILEPSGYSNYIFNDTVEVKNDGMASATNLWIALKASSPIVNSRLLFYTENATEPLRDSQGNWVTYAKRMVPKSQILISVIMNSSNRNNTEFQVFSAYDQGSTNASFTLDGRNRIVSDSPTQISGSDPIVSVILSIGGLITASLASISGVLGKKEATRRDQLVSRIRDDMCKTVNILSHPSSSTETLSGKLYGIHLWIMEPYAERRKLIYGDYDYDLIDEFLEKIKIRDNAIRRNQTQRICSLNRELLERAKIAMGEDNTRSGVSWDLYIERRTTTRRKFILVIIATTVAMITALISFLFYYFK